MNITGNAHSVFFCAPRGPKCRCRSASQHRCSLDDQLQVNKSIGLNASYLLN